MTNPNPEGLPNRIDLPEGWYTESSSNHSHGSYWIHRPDGESVWRIDCQYTQQEFYDFTRAMNTHADALGAALENTLRLLDIWVEELLKDPYGKEGAASLIRQRTEARAALEAWRSGR